MKYVQGMFKRTALSGKAILIHVLEYEDEGGRVVRHDGEDIWFPLSRVVCDFTPDDVLSQVELECQSWLMREKGLV